MRQEYQVNVQHFTPLTRGTLSFKNSCTCKICYRKDRWESMDYFI
jgi:hypothetical protein